MKFTADVVQELTGKSLTEEQMTKLTDQISTLPSPDDLKYLSQGMTLEQVRAFNISVGYFHSFAETFDELLAHETGGQIFTGEGYNTLPFITAFVKEQVMPKRENYFRKPELIR